MQEQLPTTARTQEVEQRKEQLPTTARTQEVEQRKEQLPTTARMQEVEQRKEQLPTTARMQEVEQRKEQLPRSKYLSMQSFVFSVVNNPFSLIWIILPQSRTVFNCSHVLSKQSHLFCFYPNKSSI